MAAVWAPIVFWALLVPLLIIMLVVYLKSKKLSRLVYILSVFTYAMTIMYWIDVYELGRNSIIGLLVLSSILMIYLGRIQHKSKTKATKNKTSLNLKLSITLLVIIAIITSLSASSIGFKISTTHVDQLSQADVTTEQLEGEPQYFSKGKSIYTITLENNFMPRQYELPQIQSCLYNKEKNAYAYAFTQWDTQSEYSDFGPYLNTIELGIETKTVSLKLNPEIRYKPTTPTPQKTEQVKYDTLYLFTQNKGYMDCSNLNSEDLKQAISIEIV